MSNCSCVNVLFRFELKGNPRTKPNLHLAIYELKARPEMLTNQRTLYKTTRKSRVIPLETSSLQDVCDGLVWIKEWLLVDIWLLPLSFPFGFALPVSLIITVHGWIACEQALLFWASEMSLARTRERAAKPRGAPRSRVLARLASLACRLTDERNYFWRWPCTFWSHMTSHALNYAKFYMLQLHYFYQPLSSQLFFHCIYSNVKHVKLIGEV